MAAASGSAIGNVTSTLLECLAAVRRTRLNDEDFKRLCSLLLLPNSCEDVSAEVKWLRDVDIGEAVKDAIIALIREERFECITSGRVVLVAAFQPSADAFWFLSHNVRAHHRNVFHAFAAQWEEFRSPEDCPASFPFSTTPATEHSICWFCKSCWRLLLGDEEVPVYRLVRKTDSDSIALLVEGKHRQKFNERLAPSSAKFKVDYPKAAEPTAIQGPPPKWRWRRCACGADGFLVREWQHYRHLSKWSEPEVAFKVFAMHKGKAKLRFHGVPATLSFDRNSHPTRAGHLQRKTGDREDLEELRHQADTLASIEQMIRQRGNMMEQPLSRNPVGTSHRTQLARKATTMQRAQMQALRRPCTAKTDTEERLLITIRHALSHIVPTSDPRDRELCLAYYGGGTLSAAREVLS